jgi:tripartite motif-containing protein 71
MKRRSFLQLSAAVSATALWGCSAREHGVIVHRARSRGAGAPATTELTPTSLEPQERAVFVHEGTDAHTAFDADGYAYEIEPFEGRVVERGALGSPLRQFGSYGIGSAELNHPVALAFGPDDYMYIADRGNHRIQVFDREGRHVRQIGSYGTERGRLSHPRSLAFDSHGQLWVADTLNHRIQVFERGGEAVACFGELGASIGQFNAPMALAFTEGGTLHVLDAGNHRVQRLAPDGATLGSYGETQLAFPRSLAISSDGFAFVSDTASAAVDVFDPDGRLEQRLYPSFESGAPAAPIQLSIAPEGDLHISAIAAAA